MFRVQGSGFRVERLGFRVKRVRISGFRAKDLKGGESVSVPQIASVLLHSCRMLKRPGDVGTF